MLLPDVVETVEYEALKSETLVYLSTVTGLEVQLIESDVVSLVVEAFLYREMLLRARLNNIARSAYLYTATDADLDNFVAGARLSRLENESDEALRDRYLLSLYQLSTAGARQSYIYWAKSVSADITQVIILRPEAGTVEVVYHGTNDHTQAIMQACNDEQVRPLCDTVIVTKATIIDTLIPLSLELHAGYEIISVRNRVREAFASLPLGIGDDLPLSHIYATAHVEGVYKVTTTLTSDITADEREVVVPNIIF